MQRTSPGATLKAMLWYRWLQAIRQRYRGRWALVMEAFALRHQIAVLQRSGTRRPYFQPTDRLVWVLLSRCWSGWRDSLVIIQPETVLRWRRQGFRSIWRQRSAGRWRGGRPPIAQELRALIYRMSRENRLWGAPRIHGELLKLGFNVSQSTVSRTLRSRPRRPIQSWITFLRNQLGATATTGYEEGWTLVRDRGSFSQRRPHVIFRNRKTVSDEWSRPATAQRRICPPFQYQPGLIYPIPGRARSPPCIPPLSMGKPQQNVSPPSISQVDRRGFHWCRVNGADKASEITSSAVPTASHRPTRFSAPSTIVV